MTTLLPAGQQVSLLRSRADVTVEKLLGGGGQGEVYQVRRSDGQALALKWYYPETATPEQRDLLGSLIDKGEPTARFLWPLDPAIIVGQDGFGYVMRLREPHYRSIVDLMKRRVEPTFRVLATAGFLLADSFWELHAKGLCYRDISFGNVFFEAATGEVVICDNDNVGIDGASEATVNGTLGFMAPEVVRGEAAPSQDTDLFSLAILLFYMLMVHHPLEGRREHEIRAFDLPAKRLLYGTRPVFIWDPADDSNRPVPSTHDNAILFWKLYPGFLRELFVQSFTEGVQDPGRRVRETQWRQAMVRLRDSIVYCGSCTAENFLETAKGVPQPACWQCRRALTIPPRLVIGRHVVVLNHDTELFPHHLQERHLDFGSPAASVIQHPTDPSRWGLRNETGVSWVAIRSDGTPVDVPPGRSVTLARGVRIQFGKAIGEIAV
jgi:eukaryotic-like serine/threonine-protein kinase